MRPLTAEILTIGDELCRGEIVDTNSSFLASALWERGIVATWLTSCRDEKDDVLTALAAAAGRADLILCSGGLGPTEDDLTVDCVSAGLGVEPVIHEPSRERMVERFAALRFEMTPNNIRQVRVPAGARAFDNSAGLAPGFEVVFPAPGGKSVPLFAMPGPPRELRAIWDDHVVARLGELAPERAHVAKKILRCFGRGESHLDHALRGFVDGVPGASVHYQVSYPETLVKLVVRGAREVAEATLAELVAEARRRLGDAVYGEDDATLAATLHAALQTRGATLGAAESCTGGLLGTLYTDVPGVSSTFLGSVVAYAYEAKVALLGVQKATLDAHGAVSEACAREMARGARDRLGATWAIAITGIAGPAGGTPDKPVGTVHLAVAGPGGAERVKHLAWRGSREQIRRLAAFWGMALCLRAIEETT